jgi:hypothetical protein
MTEHVEQRMPIPNGRPSIQSLVRADLERREQVGISRYGTALQAHNGRDVLRDAYEEAMDLTCYLRQAIEERDTAAAAVLPTWEQMSDRDKHEALWHVWKRESTGVAYAVENYAAMYRDHPALVALGESPAACDHAKQVVGSIDDALKRLGGREYGRLLDLDPDVED